MFIELIKIPHFWSLICVLFGFLLGEGCRYIRYRLRILKLKRIIKEELKSILAQIPQKKEIVNQIILELENKKILPGFSVGIINIGYNKHISELYKYLNINQRNCLHVIYEHLKVAEKTLFSFEQDLISSIKENIIGIQIYGKTSTKKYVMMQAFYVQLR